MSENENTPDVRRLRTEAKRLLPTLPAGSKLADAQLQIAREHGFPSWPALVEKHEVPLLLARLQRLVLAGDADRLDTLLRSRPLLRRHLDDPIFTFDTPAIVWAAGHAPKLLPILARHGADPNVRTKWWAGGYGALDAAKGETVDLLLGLGARWDVWSAAGHGRVEILRALLDEDPSLVNAPGGDGETPLHFATTPEVAELLIARGADLEARDVDHESTPIQYAILFPEVVRVLLRHGARPDVFTAVTLDDAALLSEILRDDPDAALAHVGKGEFVTRKSEGGHIYAYRVGTAKTPILFAAERRSLNALATLRGRRKSADLVAAAWLGDEKAVRELLGTPLEAEDHAALPAAAQAGRAETVRLLLAAGFDPLTPGMDSGTSLHVAAWFGWPEVVRLLAGRVPLDLGDAHHGSPPLGWALHGAQWCGNPQGDYPAVVEILLAAGADPNAPANRNGASMLDQAGDREDVKAVLRARM